MSRLDTLIATVTAIDRADSSAIWGRARVASEPSERSFVAYPPLTGPLQSGTTVVLNVTATALGLGTGGVDFVLGTLPPAKGESGAGDEHIIKLRYTPLQHAVAVAEQQPSGDEPESLGGTPVVACLLHSQLAPVAAAAKAKNPSCRVAYVMTDSAALPLAFSRLVVQLREAGLLDTTLTCGQAFGGEHECVTLPSALLAARALGRADLIVVAPGPGNAGTGTRYGFSGIEQAWVLQVTNALGGEAVCCLRASQADPRPRHQGVSHHSHTVLRLCGCRPRAGWPEAIPVPENLDADLFRADPRPGLALLAERGIRVTSMGRTVEQDPLFFEVSAASGCI